MRRYSVLLIGFLLVLSHPFITLIAQESAPAYPYNIGNPTLTDLWVDPINGDDNHDGLARDRAFKTVDRAWQQIPVATRLTTGYHIWLLPGNFSPEMLPNYWESRYGTAAAPIIIEPAEGPNTVTTTSLNIFDTHYLYLLNFTISDASDNIFHCERCTYLLLRNMTIVGPDPETYAAKETVKVNQSQYVYIEDSDISGAWDNPIDMVSVQYGHVVGNRLHNGGDWCIYAKGGSAYFRIERNDLYECGTGGFTAGQGTGFEFMEAPWLQYEAYDIKFVNNVIHDVAGAAFGVNGGYNILIAYNTAYRVGERSHVIEVGPGLRTCDGDPRRCAQNVARGGWGPPNVGIEEPTPSRNVLIYNNIIYNPSGYRSQWQHFSVVGPRAASDGTNILNPVLSDDNLQIRGNIIWNGRADMPMGIDEGSSGCASSNPTCNINQLLTDNAINTLEPQLVNAAQNDFRPTEGGNIYSAVYFPIPDFVWDDPLTPAGNVTNHIGQDYTGGVRPTNSIIGAFAGVSSGSAGVSTTTSPTTTLPASDTTTTTRVEKPTSLPAGPVTIVTLGDSLTEGAGDDSGIGGYPGRLIGLINDLRPGSSIMNLGQSGWNSDALIHGDQGLPGQLSPAVAQLQTATSAGQPALALVWIGSNDLWYLYEYGSEPMNPDEELVDAEHFTQNIDRILSELSATGAVVIIALVDDQSKRPVALAGEAFPATTPQDLALMSAQVNRYNAAIQQKADQHGALVVDFFNTTIFTDPVTLYDDGNHPNQAGYDVIAQRWFEAITPLLP